MNDNMTTTANIIHNESFLRYSSKDVALCSKGIYDLKWNACGSYLACAIGDKTVKIGQLTESSVSSRPIQTIPQGNIINQICWHPTEDGRFSFCGDDKYLEVWDLRASRAAVKATVGASTINCVWSPDGNFIALGNRNDVVSIFDLRTGTIMSSYRFPYEVNELAWTVNTDYILATTGADGVGAVDLIFTKNSSLQMVNTISAHTANCMNIKVDSSYQRMAVGSLDYLVSLWDLGDLICHHTFNMESEVRAMAYSGDGRYIAAISEDGVLAICDADSGEFLSKVSSKVRLGTVAWHPSSALLAVSCDDKSNSAPVFCKLLHFSG